MAHVLGVQLVAYPFFVHDRKKYFTKIFDTFHSRGKGGYCKYHLSISFLPSQSKIEMAHVLGVQFTAYPFFVHGRKKYFAKIFDTFHSRRKGGYCKYHLSISFLPPQSKIEMAHVLGVYLVAYPFFVHGRKKHFAKIFDAFYSRRKGGYCKYHLSISSFALSKQNRNGPYFRSASCCISIFCPWQKKVFCKNF